MLHKAEGIIIRTNDYGEGHKIITLYTRQWGKVGLIARGAKKLNSRLSAVTQLFTYGEYTFFKSSGLGSLNSGESIASRQKIREDLMLAAYASYMTELFDKLTNDLDASNMLFEQLKAAFDGLESGKDPDILMHIMEMKLLAIGGYAPQLNQCVVCNAGHGNMMLSVLLGGLMCSHCRGRDTTAFPLNEVTLKLLRLFQQVDLRRLGATDVKPSTKAQLKRCVRSLLDAHIDVRLKSRSFLDQLEKYDLS